eukprot:410137_1
MSQRTERRDSCPKGRDCHLVQIGKCTQWHPDCWRGQECKFVLEKRCPYFHPPFHFRSRQISIAIEKSDINKRMPDLERRRHHENSSPHDSDDSSEESSSDDSSSSSSDSSEEDSSDEENQDKSVDNTNWKHDKKEAIMTLLRQILMYRSKEDNKFEVQNIKQLIERVSELHWNAVSELEKQMGCRMDYHYETKLRLERKHGRIHVEQREKTIKLLKKVKEKCMKHVENIDSILTKLENSHWLGGEQEFESITKHNCDFFHGFCESLDDIERVSQRMIQNKNKQNVHQNKNKQNVHQNKKRMQTTDHYKHNDRAKRNRHNPYL